MNAKPSINLIWLKRDLRLRDHAPLAAAALARLPVLIAYWFEPNLLQSPESDVRHWRFVQESLSDLRAQLAKRRIPLYVFHAEVLPVLQQLSDHFTIQNIFSHQETGTKLTFDRDLAVRQFCRAQGIRWVEFGQDGVRRGAKNREGWQEYFEQTVKAPIVEVNWSQFQPCPLPESLWQACCGPELPTAYNIPNANFQPGGETYAWRYLQSFLAERASSYSRHLSKPQLSRKSCSRLSPYLAWGNLSMRQIYQLAESRAQQPGFDFNLRNFQSRLWWRSHYIQKLESWWQLEFEPINAGLQAIDRTLDERFEAWAAGRTGFPMVDASMRCLEATGWLNFRMRAMLATFVAFALWQDWRAAALHLARYFLDFEPGIHYAQFQMQAGLTGYHPLRIFNPIVQAQRHDPDGSFVRQWLPELRHVPAPQIYAPWYMTSLEQSFYQCRIGVDYPEPIVNYETAIRTVKERYWAFRQRPEVQRCLPEIWERLCIPKDVEQYRRRSALEGA